MPPKTLENTIDLVKAVSSDTSGGLVFLFDNIKLGAKLSKSKPGKLQWRPFFLPSGMCCARCDNTQRARPLKGEGEDRRRELKRFSGFRFVAGSRGN